MLQSFLLFFLTFIDLDASGLSCSMWDLASCSGVKLWECRVLATGPSGKSHKVFLNRLSQRKFIYKDKSIKVDL